MATIRPFRATRYNLNRTSGLQNVIGPPDDIPSLERASELTYGKPFHCLRLEMPNPAKPDDCSKPAECYDSWHEAGVLFHDDEPSLYAYEHQFEFDGKQRIQRGVFATVDLPEKPGTDILPHENTIPDNFALRLNLLRHVNVNTSALYTIMDDGGQLERLLATLMVGQPDIEGEGVDDEGGYHRIWRITDPVTIDVISALGRDHPLYIADGHHRFAAALAYRDELLDKGLDPGRAGRTLTFITSVDDPGVFILPIHRELRQLSNADREAGLEKLAQWFEIEEIPDGHDERLVEQLGELQVSDPENIRFLLLGPNIDDRLKLTVQDPETIAQALSDVLPEPLRTVTTAIAHRLILAKAFGITEEVVDELITYSPDLDTAIARLQDGEISGVLAVQAPSTRDLVSVAGAGHRMPQKSTYFYPKVPAGIVLYDLNVDRC